MEQSNKAGWFPRIFSVSINVVGIFENGSNPLVSSHAVIPMLYISDFSVYPERFCSNTSGANQFKPLMLFCGKSYMSRVLSPCVIKQVHSRKPHSTAFVWFSKIWLARIARCMKPFLCKYSRPSRTSRRMKLTNISGKPAIQTDILNDVIVWFICFGHRAIATMVWQTYRLKSNCSLHRDKNCSTWSATQHIRPSYLQMPYVWIANVVNWKTASSLFLPSILINKLWLYR